MIDLIMRPANVISERKHSDIAKIVSGGTETG